MNPIREALDRGEPAFGFWCSVPTPVGVELIARQGFSWIVIDLQHGEPSFGELTSLAHAAQAGGAAVAVRVGSNEPAAIMRALDLGAFAVIVPMIWSGVDAAGAAAAARYPPVGVRSFGPTRAKYATVDEANDDVLCIAMVEDSAAMGDLASIASAPGVDGLFVGPVDLGLSLGVGLQRGMRHPVIEEAFGAVVAEAERQRRFVATVAADHDHARQLVARGVRVVCVGNDKAHLAAGAAADARFIRQLLDAR